MDVAKIEAEPRAEQGTRAARRLRKWGRLPGIIYGHGEAPRQVSLPAHDLELLLTHGAHLLALQIDGRQEQVLIKDVQYDHTQSKPIHVDLARVNLDERVHVTVPLELRGSPKGTHEGGILDQPISDLEVECLVTQIPEMIRVNVAHLDVGQSLHVSDLELPEGVTAATEPGAIVCAVRTYASGAVETEGVEEPEAASTSPEIIGRKEKEEGEASAGKKAS